MSAEHLLNNPVEETPKVRFADHPEWKDENSLTDPMNRTHEYMNTSSSNQGIVLSEEEIKECMKEQNVNSHMEKFRKLEKLFADPSIPGQNIALFSFTPSMGAQPDETGVYGMIKCRGVFQTAREANERAEYLFRTVDSYHKIYHSYVGKPFPLTFNPNYFEEVDEVDLKNKVKDTEGDFLKISRDQEQKIMNEIKDRVNNIKEEMSENRPTKGVEEYITLQVKRANLALHRENLERAFIEYGKMVEMFKEKLQEVDQEFPDYKNVYVDEYLKEAEKVAIEIDTNFLKHLKDY